MKTKVFRGTKQFPHVVVRVEYDGTRTEIGRCYSYVHAICLRDGYRKHCEALHYTHVTQLQVWSYGMLNELDTVPVCGAWLPTRAG